MAPSELGEADMRCPRRHVDSPANIALSVQEAGTRGDTPALSVILHGDKLRPEPCSDRATTGAEGVIRIRPAIKNGTICES